FITCIGNIDNHRGGKKLPKGSEISVFFKFKKLYLCTFKIQNDNLMTFQHRLEQEIKNAVKSIYGEELENVELQPTRKDFEGDITAVVFPMLRVVKGNPVQIGQAIGKYLVENMDEVEKFNVVQGFLNIFFTYNYSLEFFYCIKDFSCFRKIL